MSRLKVSRARALGVGARPPREQGWGPQLELPGVGILVLTFGARAIVRAPTQGQARMLLMRWIQTGPKAREAERDVILNRPRGKTLRVTLPVLLVPVGIDLVSGMHRGLPLGYFGCPEILETSASLVVSFHAPAWRGWLLGGYASPVREHLLPPSFPVSPAASRESWSSSRSYRPRSIGRPRQFRFAPRVVSPMYVGGAPARPYLLFPFSPSLSVDSLLVPFGRYREGLPVKNSLAYGHAKTGWHAKKERSGDSKNAMKHTVWSRDQQTRHV